MQHVNYFLLSFTSIVLFRTDSIMLLFQMYSKFCLLTMFNRSQKFRVWIDLFSFCVKQVPAQSYQSRTEQSLIVCFVTKRYVFPIASLEYGICLLMTLCTVTLSDIEYAALQSNSITHCVLLHDFVLSRFRRLPFPVIRPQELSPVLSPPPHTHAVTILSLCNGYVLSKGNLCFVRLSYVPWVHI